MQQYSILDLAPVGEGESVTEAIGHVIELAQLADQKGYHRYWLAEHHNMPGIASAATAVLIGAVAANTKRIRVGSGGVMLPNHAPLVIAEQFGTLEALYPDRIDLGLGRAPGTDAMTMRALRRQPQDVVDSSPQDVIDLLAYLGDPATSGTRIIANPGADSQVPVWILGSSLYGAQLAAQLGLPYAFASHFAPAMLDQAAHLYRSSFQPSQWADKPYFVMAAGICVADSDEEADYLRSSQLQAFARLHTGMPGKIPRPIDNIESEIPPRILAGVKQALACSAAGAPDTVAAKLETLIDRHKPDEIMVTGAIHDHQARLASFDKAAAILDSLIK